MAEGLFMYSWTDACCVSPGKSQWVAVCAPETSVLLHGILLMSIIRVKFVPSLAMRFQYSNIYKHRSRQRCLWTVLPLSADLERNSFFQSPDFSSMPTGVASCSTLQMVVWGKQVALGGSSATTSWSCSSYEFYWHTIILNLQRMKSLGQLLYYPISAWLWPLPYFKSNLRREWGWCYCQVSSLALERLAEPML